MRGLVRLISSASTMLAKTGPGMNWNSPRLLMEQAVAEDVGGQEVGGELEAA